MRGDIQGAAELLGHAPYLEARVGERTDRRWHLSFDYTPALPPPGSYRATLRGGGEAVLTIGHDGAASISPATVMEPGRVRLDVLGPSPV